MHQERAYNYRFSPTPEQAQTLARTFGGVRYTSHGARRHRTDAYEERQERRYDEHRSAALTTLKPQEAPAWLHEVSRVPWQPALRH